MAYYDWNKTLSYDADVTIVITPRGTGKTYGIRLQGIRDYLKSGYRFVELVRYKSELDTVSSSYFTRIERNNHFPDKVFKTDSKHMYIADKPANEDDKPKWEIIGYFIAMTQYQKVKKRTFDKVKRIILDEGVLDRRDRYYRYLKSEFIALASIVDTVSRERADDESIRPHIYICGNACDISNPYFIRYGINDPKPGYSWYGGKTCLLHYMLDREYTQAKRDETVAGRMLAGVDNTSDIDGIFANDFKPSKRPKTSTYIFGLSYLNQTLGVWRDHGHWYVSREIDGRSSGNILAVTKDDKSTNGMMAVRARKALQSFGDYHVSGLVDYEDAHVARLFLDILSIFGVK